eukprot:m.30453 g.30453  ORF g.30453 m.30453 type:complete len:61 (+) comp9640_c0_seq1:54-236(+)
MLYNNELLQMFTLHDILFCYVYVCFVSFSFLLISFEQQSANHFKRVRAYVYVFHIVCLLL